MSSPELVTLEPLVVAFLSMRGPYAQIPESFGRLYTLVGEHSLNPVGMPAVAYLTSPEQVPEADARWEVFVPVAGRPDEHGADDTGFGVKALEPTLVVSAMHRGPYETLGTTYQQIQEFIAAEGYVPDGPWMERYYSDPNTVSPDEYLTEILIPVRSA